MRIPPLFSNAVTLIPLPSVPDLALLPSTPRPAARSKTASPLLDLAPHGFGVLFDAQWIMSSTPPAKAWSVPSDWTEFTDPDGLGIWEEARCQDHRPRGLFRRDCFLGLVVVLGRISERPNPGWRNREPERNVRCWNLQCLLRSRFMEQRHDPVLGRIRAGISLPDLLWIGTNGVRHWLTL